MIRKIILLANVILASIAFASAQEPPWPTPCVDLLKCIGVFAPSVDPDGDAVSYEIVDVTTNYGCLVLHPTNANGRLIPARTWYDPKELPTTGLMSCFPPEGLARTFAVRAFDSFGNSAGLGNTVTFVGQPVACVRSNPDCEFRCYLGAPKRIPSLPLCPEE